MKINDELKLVEIFCCSDDFTQLFDESFRQFLLAKEIDKKKVNQPSLSNSEIMTIVIFYHLSGFKCFMYYYVHFVLPRLRTYFPNLVSYNRFVELMPRVNLYLFAFINLCRLGAKTGIYYLDSAKIAVCHNLRIHSNKVFKGIAKRGKTSTGWFYGMKLHLIINHVGEVLAFWLTPGNVSDNDTNVVLTMCKTLLGKLFGDKGYISHQLSEKLLLQGLTLFTKLRKNMKNKLIEHSDKLLLKKRGVIESVFDILKSICDIEHSRHRSPANAIVNLWAGLAAYTFCDQLPSIRCFLELQSRQLAKVI